VCDDCIFILSIKMMMGTVKGIKKLKQVSQ
jgi:hypothetical protein